MATTLSNVPSFPDERRLRGPDNWKQFKDYVISAVRSKGLAGYLDGTIKLPTSPTAADAKATPLKRVQNGTIKLPTSPTAADAKATPLNSTSPSQEEWQFREGHVSGLIYQNIINPDSHSIGPEDAAVTMWSTLKGKFEVSTQIHQDIAMKHLETLKLRVAASGVGCKIEDSKMISVILASLPPSWIILVQVHQSKKVLSEVTAALVEYWTFLTRDNDPSAPDPTAYSTATALVPAVPVLICDNCGAQGHSKFKCWAAGGGKEGQGLKWWRAPKGKEPRIGKAPTVASTSYQQSQAVPQPAPTTAAIAAYTPMETYTIGKFTTGDNGLVKGLRTEYMNYILATVSNIANNTPTNLSLSLSHPTYLDSGANVTCVVDRQRFITYASKRSSGTTPNNEFSADGEGIVKFETRGQDGVIRRLFLTAMHTPSFSMNLISLPALDRKGFSGTWGGGVMTVVDPKTGKTVVDGHFLKSEGSRMLYEVDVVDSPVAAS
ncbi:hypothetical protein EV359DRAFT_68074, partial [Lentinula novae-zelandiae]